MQRILFALAAFVLTGALVATAEDPTPIQLPAAQPKVVQPRPVQPLQPRPIMVTAAKMTQLEEDFETAEAQRDVKKAYVKAAEVGVRVVEVNLDQVVKLYEKGVISKDPVEKAKLEVEVAKAQVMIRMAELKESEVKVKFAKKRLDDAKLGGVRPLPGVRPVPVDPTPNVLSTEKTIAELKIKIDTLIVEAEQRAEKVKRAGLILVVAEQSLEKLREVAKVSRLQGGTIERAEAVVAEAQTQVAKLSAERKALDAEIDVLRKKLKEIGK